MPSTAHRRHSYAEYLAFEEASDVKHEYCDGAIVAMAGGTPEHSLLKSNLLGLAHAALSGRPCRPFDSDLRVRVPSTTLATYPDLSVICGPLQRDVEDRNAAVNPTLLAEVLSPSTAAYDRGEKLDHYAHLTTLREVVLIDSTRAHVDVYRRLGEKAWERHGYGPGERIPLGSIEVSIELDELYDGWAELVATPPPASAPSPGA